MIEADGALQPARQKLSDAIAALIDPTRRTLPTGKHTWLDSVYCQLSEAVYEKHALGGGRATPASPLWLAASDCLHDIDHATKLEHPDKPDDDIRVTIWRLQAIDARTWRPQDTRHILEFTATIEKHTLTAENLLDPPTRWSLPDPCPLCGKDYVYVDDAGDQVRRPALTLNENYCRCQNHNCEGFWSKEKFRFLGELLGRQPPEGIIA